MPPIDPNRKLTPFAVPQAQQQPEVPMPQPMPFPGAGGNSIPLPPINTTRRDQRVVDQQREDQRIGISAIHAKTAQDADARAQVEEAAKIHSRDITGGVDPAESERTAGFLTTQLTNHYKGIRAILKENPRAAKPGWVETGLRQFNDTLADWSLGSDTKSARIRLNLRYGLATDVLLTLGTGAAYTDTQFQLYKDAYSPKVTDTDSVLKEKKALMKEAIEAARIKSGVSADQIEKVYAELDNLYSPERALLNSDGSVKATTSSIGGVAGTELDSAPPAVPGSNEKVTSRVSPEQQEAYRSTVSQIRRGNLTPAVYAAIVNSTYRESEPISQDDPDVLKWVEAYNNPSSSFTWEIPPATRKISGGEKTAAGGLASEAGTAVLSAGDAMSGGLLANLFSEESQRGLDATKAAHPGYALAGDIAGAAIPVAGMEKIAGAGLARLAPRMLTSAGELVPRAKLGTEALANIAYGATRGATGADEGDMLSGAARGAGYGALGTGAAHLATGGARSLVSADTRSAVDALADPAPGLRGRVVNKLGGQSDQLTTMQRLGAGKQEEVLKATPFVRGTVKKAEENFNLTNADRALRHIGAKLPKGTEAGTASTEAVRGILSKEYNNIMPQISGTIDATARRNFTALRAQANTPLRKTLLKDIEGYMSNLLNKSGQYDGASYKDTMTSLRTLSADWRDTAGAAADASGRPSEYVFMARLADSVADQVRSLAGRNNKEIAQRLKNVDTGWKQYVRINKATVAASDQGGVYSAGGYLNAIKSLDESAGKTAIGRGAGFDQKFAQQAISIMGSKKVPETVSLFQLFATSYGLTTPVGKVIAAGLAANYAPLLGRVTKALVSGKRPTAIDNQLVRNAIAEITRQQAAKGEK